MKKHKLWLAATIVLWAAAAALRWWQLSSAFEEDPRLAIPFAPANCAPAVKEWGARVLNHCDDHAVAQAIEILDGIYL